ncbi:hypothetical protein ATI02_4337 [Pseudomonas baetica]|uniref:CHAD domain-containing protein n=1 Tax=Pseudomonas baetica TaxID=674054 RepID=A0ABX4Q3J4_9PSED|nr:hypothetical protein [Pseudomonas baetica]PKA71359.1 hypothetical protein ATI02_4337 [Pseudomonas baetica]PTC19857.1 hypothetical protein C0J26_07620 [Pseudomonas baetica]
MSESKRNQKIELKINPAVKTVLENIAVHVRAKNVSELVDKIINDVTLSTSSLKQQIDSVASRLSTIATQSNLNFDTLFARAVEERIPVAMAELEALTIELKLDTYYDTQDLFKARLKDLDREVKELLRVGRSFRIDDSKEALSLIDRLNRLDIHFNLPAKRNYYSRHSLDSYSKIFKKGLSFNDPYNRRALGFKLKDLKIYTDSVDEKLMVKVEKVLENFNKKLKDMNTDINLKKSADGIATVYKSINQLRKVVSELKKQYTGGSNGRS